MCSPPVTRVLPRDHAVLNIHHICAPSFCGEHEVLAGLPARAHTAVCTTPETIVMGVPASVFHALVLSGSSRRRYATSAKLATVLNLRRKWYVLRPRGTVPRSYGPMLTGVCAYRCV